MFLKRIGIDGFICALFLAIFAAWLYPEPGAYQGVFSLSKLSTLCVSVIFFFYGLRLNWVKLRQGLSNVKMHVVVLLASFVFFPALVLAIMATCHKLPSHDDVAAIQTLTVVEESKTEPVVDVEVGTFGASTSTIQNAPNMGQDVGIWLGIFFLATLPSTVSSSVVMTNIAKGNVPAAIFDASVSSLLGVFVTPLWMNIFVDAQSGGRDLGAVLLMLVGQVILPLTLGVVLNRYWGEFARRHERKLGRFDQCSIVLIVYVSFCTSFKEKMFSDLSALALTKLALGMAALFFAVFFSIYCVCRLMKFNRADMIATLFCGSKKSLVHGVTTSRAIVSAPQLLGVIILPTMIYHALQLVFVSAIAQSFAKKSEVKEEVGAGESNA